MPLSEQDEERLSNAHSAAHRRVREALHNYFAEPPLTLERRRAARVVDKMEAALLAIKREWEAAEPEFAAVAGGDAFCRNARDWHEREALPMPAWCAATAPARQRTTKAESVALFDAA